MRDWDAQRIARAAGAELVREPSPVAERPGPAGVGIDSRRLDPGDLFIALRGARVDGGEHAAQALRGGAWGALLTPRHAQAALQEAGGGALLAHEDPLEGLHMLANAWRAQLAGGGTKVVAITGSTGKTSTKDILAALLSSHVRVAASPENLNTEIGLPLAILAAPEDSQALVLEMAMRGRGQIAQLADIAEPDVGVIVNIGPAHLELLGSIEAIAAAKAELIAGLAPGASVVVPAAEALLADHLRADLRTVTFGAGGDVRLLERRENGSVVIAHGDEEMLLRPSFSQAHNLQNLLAAVAAARALGYTPAGTLEVNFSTLRGQRLALAGGVILVNDCYNANPMSMRAAIDDLCQTAPARRIAVLGDMLELGSESPRLHREIGEYAQSHGVELLLSVGPLASEIARSFAGESHAVADARAAGELLARLLLDGDTVLVKGSRGVGLERVAAMLAGSSERARHSALGDSLLAPGLGRGRR